MSAPARIVVFGPESTGKTSLTAALAAHFGEPWSAEYVRQYWDEHGGVVTAADLDDIGRGQLAGEEAAEERARRVVFADTDLLTCVLWDDLLFPGSCPPWVRAMAGERARGAALYLFCETDLPWEPDPQRCYPDDEGRAMCRRVFLEALTSRGLPHVIVRGRGEERLRGAIAAVEAVLSRRR